MTETNRLPWEIEKIINVSAAISCHLTTGASTGEQIAAAFVLNRMEYLPEGYSDVIEAWERLGDWQGYVQTVKADYMYLIKERVKKLSS